MRQRAFTIRSDACGIEPATLGEVFKIDQQRVAGMRRKALVGEPIAMGRVDRQRLPDGDASTDQKIDEPEGICPEIAVVESSGEGRQMQENTRTPTIQNAIRLLHDRFIPHRSCGQPSGLV